MMVRSEASKLRNKERIKERYANDPAVRERVKIYSQNWEAANREKRRKQRKVWRDTNSDILREYRKQRRDTQPPDSKEILSNVLRNRINTALNGNYKAGSAVRDLGCSLEEFRAYIEKQWLPGMTWENWTKDGWHLDHIKPLASFDLTIREQFIKACHYTNYQPLWAKDNLLKGDKDEIVSL